MSLLQQQQSMMEYSGFPHQRIRLYLTILATFLNKLYLLVLHERQDFFVAAKEAYKRSQKKQQ